MRGCGGLRRSLSSDSALRGSVGLIHPTRRLYFSRERRLHWHKITGHMPIRPIIRYPDPRLALPAQPVTVFDDELRDLARDLLETMHAAPGIGITAPHIGISLRVVVLDLDPLNGALTYVNPDII